MGGRDRVRRRPAPAVAQFGVAAALTTLAWAYRVLSSVDADGTWGGALVWTFALSIGLALTGLFLESLRPVLVGAAAGVLGGLLVSFAVALVVISQIGS